MERIKLSTPPTKTSFSHQSKGNQWKWFADDIWLKTDYLGYESLSEVVVSEFLKHSNIDYFVEYTPIYVEYNGTVMRGCCSKSFMEEEWDLITFERYHVLNTTFSLSKTLAQITNTDARVKYTFDYYERLTGIKDLGSKLSQLFSVDALFLNEDRHTNNLSLIYDSVEKAYHLAPIYDNGAALFSDTKLAYPINLSYEECLIKCKCKPFNEDFDTQLDAIDSLRRCNVRFNLTTLEAKGLFEEIVKSYELDSMYSDQELRRVDDTLRMQIRKYSYMFK